MTQYDDDADRFDDDDEDDQPSEDVTCKYCGATGLTWFDTGVRWRLIGEDKKPHVCKPSADDFEVL